MIPEFLGHDMWWWYGQLFLFGFVGYWSAKAKEGD